jgi:phosphohistidine phosphatase
MKLYFLRHGEAASANGTTIRTDTERPLTKEGIDILKIQGKAFAKLNILPDIIWSSPLVRARQTAEVIAKQLEIEDRIVEMPQLACGATLDQIREIIDTKPHVQSAMFVGHEPDFSTIIGKLISRSGSTVEMKKGGIALIETELPLIAGGGVLMWLLTPKIILKMN